MKTDELANPDSILLVGNGRLAKHLQFYFRKLKLPFKSWHRKLNCTLDLSGATHVLLAVSDSSLQTFINANLQNFTGKIIHFSGAIDLPGTIAAHPLMTFADKIYPEDFYRKIPFVISGAHKLAEAIPGLPNEFYVIKPSQKAYYHALCVLGGNFTTLLVQRMLKGFTQIGLPSTIANLYLSQILENSLAQSESALTGPLARKDVETLEKNLASLRGDPFEKVYRSFVAAHSPELLPGLSLEETC